MAGSAPRASCTRRWWRRRVGSPARWGTVAATSGGWENSLPSSRPAKQLISGTGNRDSKDSKGTWGARGRLIWIMTALWRWCTRINKRGRSFDGLIDMADIAATLARPPQRILRLPRLLAGSLKVCLVFVGIRWPRTLIGDNRRL